MARITYVTESTAFFPWRQKHLTLLVELARRLFKIESRPYVDEGPAIGVFCSYYI
jgi:hypothetical protein